MPSKDNETLSARELDVLNLLAKGLTKTEIAKVLEISPNTVDGHVKNLYAKLGVRNGPEDVYEALMTGYLKVTQ